jgi:hypothetical protein
MLPRPKSDRLRPVPLRFGAAMKQPPAAKRVGIWWATDPQTFRARVHDPGNQARMRNDPKFGGSGNPIYAPEAVEARHFDKPQDPVSRPPTHSRLP